LAGPNAESRRHARQRLADRLRQTRKQSGLSGVELAARLGASWDQPKVSKIETGKRLPSEADVEAWAVTTGTDPTELLSLLERARGEYATSQALFAQAGGAAALQATLGAAEQAATRVGEFQPVVIMGLLQTGQYAHELLHLAGSAADDTPEDEIARMIAGRLRRAAILYEPDREVTLLMGEAALRNRLASPATMRDQLAHVARIAETAPPNVTIGIVPFSQPWPVAAIGGWRLLDDLLLIEIPAGGDLEIADPVEVERYWQYMRLLLDVAATRSEVAELCRRAAADLES
jgi:transcriptional regulator with XRE-family HTH domain